MDRAGFDPTMGPAPSRSDQQEAWAVAGGAVAAGAGAGAAGERPGYRGQDESGAGGGSGGGSGGGGNADTVGATDLGWLSAEQLAAMGLARREDVVKSTSMVR